MQRVSLVSPRLSRSKSSVLWTTTKPNWIGDVLVAAPPGRREGGSTGLVGVRWGEVEGGGFWVRGGPSLNQLERGQMRAGIQELGG